MILLFLVLHSILPLNKCLIESYGFLQKPNQMLLQAHATQSGIIRLKNSHPGFKVNVDFSSDPIEASDNETNPTTMLFSLHTTQNMLSSTSGMSFNPYNCSEFSSSCTIYPNETMDIVYPSFKAVSYMSTTNLYVDYSYWILRNSTFALAYICQTSGTSSYGSNTYGILGMANTENYNMSDVFSIYVDSDGNAGSLTFSKNSSYDLTSFQANLTTDENLHTSGVESIKIFNHNLSTPNTSLIFDINVGYIGLPYHIFNLLIENFNKLLNISCLDSTVLCQCHNKTLANFPDVIIYVQNQNITLPPSVYTKNFNSQSSTVTLIFQALSNSMSGPNYVTHDYEDHIIFGYPVMSYYYTVFEVNSSCNHTISLYAANRPINGSPWKLLTLGLFVIVAIIVIGYNCFRKAKFKSYDILQVNRAPLINNNQNRSIIGHYNRSSIRVASFNSRSISSSQHAREEAYPLPVRESTTNASCLGRSWSFI